VSSDVSERTQVGQRLLDRYRIVRELGSGAFGTVYLAEDEVTTRRVAVRFLPRALAAVPSAARAVQNMGRSIAAGSITHPGLVRVLELGEAEPGQPFVVMELLEGRHLSELLSGGTPVDPVTARRWALDLGACVEALHNAGLVHGGLRPRNVMILPDGYVKLMDVELAGLRAAPTQQSILDRIPAEYVSPEQIRRERSTEKTDIYALAVMAYELLSGTPPFEAATRDAVIAKQLNEPPPPMGRRHATPAPGERVVMQALEKDPELRPWIDEMLNGLWEEANVPVGRRWMRPIAIGGGAALGAAIIALAIGGVLAPRPPGAGSVARPTVPPAGQAPVGARSITSPRVSEPAAPTRTESTTKLPAPPTVPSPTVTVAPPVPGPPAAPPGPPAAPVPPPVRTTPATPPAAPPPAARVASAPSSTVGSAPPSAALVQAHRKTYRVGWLDSGRITVPYQDLVKQALVGYPRDVAFEYRSADGQTARLQEFAAELVQLKVDVVFAVGNPAIEAAKQATSTIPSVMVGSDAARRDESTANITGVTYSSAELARRWVSLLKEIRPSLSRVAVLFSADPANQAVLTALQNAAADAGVRVQPYTLQEGDALGTMFAGPAADRAEAIVVPGGPSSLVHLRRIVCLAGRARVPSVYGSSEFVDAGGLLAYGPSIPAIYRRAGAYIGKILGPTHPRDLPIEQPSRSELVVNLKTARALGLTLPSSLVLRADRVVQ